MKLLIKSYNVALVIAVILVTLYISAQFVEENQYRRIKAIVGWFVHLPLLLLGFVFTAGVISGYMSKKIELKKAVRTIPMLLILVYFFVMIVISIFKSL